MDIFEAEMARRFVVAVEKIANALDRKDENSSEIPNNCEDEPKTQTETQNSNLTFEKDECAKEYEELGLKELKELIEADHKTENSSEKPNSSTISKMEQVDKDTNVRSKDEPKTQMKTQNSNLTFEKADEPQVVMPKECKGCDSASKIIEAYSRGFEDGAEAVKAVQTDCSWK